MIIFFLFFKPIIVVVICNTSLSRTFRILLALIIPYIHIHSFYRLTYPLLSYRIFRFCNLYGLYSYQYQILYIQPNITVSAPSLPYSPSLTPLIVDIAAFAPWTWPLLLSMSIFCCIPIICSSNWSNFIVPNGKFYGIWMKSRSEISEYL